MTLEIRVSYNESRETKWEDSDEGVGVKIAVFLRVGVKERWCGYSEVYGIGKQWVGTFGAINLSELTLDSLEIISREIISRRDDVGILR